MSRILLGMMLAAGFFGLGFESGHRPAFNGGLQAQEAPKLPKADTPAPMKKFKTGARPTPKHKLFAAPRFDHMKAKAPPAQFAWVPSKLSMWLNDQYGDCVTAEEAFKCATQGIFIQDSTVQAWASANGVLDGADLQQVIQAMQQKGFQQDGNTYGDGPGSVINFSDETALQTAIAAGPVKIGIDANALPSGAGNQNGWVGTGGSPGQFTNEDHCVALCGYGTAQYLFQQLHVPLPSTLQPTQTGYLLFTWNTIGFVDHAWIMSTVGEAWLRTPNEVTTGNGPIPPDPPLNPTPSPTPPMPPIPPAPVPPTPPAIPTGTIPASDGGSFTISYTPPATGKTLNVDGVPDTVVQALQTIIAAEKAKNPAMPKLK